MPPEQNCAVWLQKLGKSGISCSSTYIKLTLYTSMFAIRARRKVATEKDFLAAVDKVIKGNLKFSSTSTYMQYN